MAFCPNCGAQLEEGMKFCMNCGTRVETQPAVQAVPQPEAVQPEFVQPDVFQAPVSEVTPEPPVQQSEPSTIIPDAPAEEDVPKTMMFTPKKKADPKVEAPVEAPAEVPFETPPAAPAVEEPAVQTPVYQQPVYEAPQQNVYQQPAQQNPYQAPQQSAYQQPVQEPAYQQAPQQNFYQQQPVQQQNPYQQNAYQAPQQNVYQQPGQQYYQAPAQQPAKKKGKALPIIIILAVVLLGLAAVALWVWPGFLKADGTSSDPNAGLYEATTVQMWGETMSIEDIYENGFTVELKDKGKCKLTVDGTSANGKWSLEDGVFHVKGGGLECDGTLDNGVMTILDVMDTGMDITLVREGGSSSAGGSTASGELSALQTQWNGDYYGVAYISDGFGDYSYFSENPDFYDAYMSVNVDASGAGEYAVYIAGGDKALANGSCQVNDNNISSNSVNVLGEDGVAYNWSFMPMRDYPDCYTMTDDFTDSYGNGFSVTFFFKMWGNSWADVAASGTSMVPPSMDSYEDSIANGGSCPYNMYGPVGSAGGNAGGETPDSTSTDFSGETEVYDYCGWNKIYITYPSDTFEVDTDAILETIAAKDGSVKISMLDYNSSANKDEVLAGFDEYADYEEYSRSETTLNGYTAYVMTYYYDWFGYTVEYYVDLGEPETSDGLYGFKFSVCSEYSFDDCYSDEVMAILNSITEG